MYLRSKGLTLEPAPGQRLPEAVERFVPPPLPDKKPITSIEQLWPLLDLAGYTMAPWVQAEAARALVEFAKENSCAKLLRDHPEAMKQLDYLFESSCPPDV